MCSTPRARAEARGGGGLEPAVAAGAASASFASTLDGAEKARCSRGSLEPPVSATKYTPMTTRSAARRAARADASSKQASPATQEAGALHLRGKRSVAV